MAKPDTTHTNSKAANLARLLDSQFAIPGTNIRFGLDAILGLIPGIGDFITAGFSLFILAEAHRRGVSNRVLARMLVNIGLDWLIGLVPLFGDVADVFFKANLKNVELLERELAKKQL